jgi:hypothetical protein
MSLESESKFTKQGGRASLCLMRGALVESISSLSFSTYP